MPNPATTMTDPTSVPAKVVDTTLLPMSDLHRSGINRTLTWRRTQLLSLRRLIHDNKPQFLEALASDLGKHPVEAESSELSTTLGEIDALLSELPSFLTPRPVPSPGLLAPCYSEVRNEPLRPPGVLVIGPFNYPVNLTLVPAAGSLASGNPTVIKPSELSPKTSSLLAALVPTYFEPSALAVLEGGVDLTTELLKRSWGLIFFTGSTRVGKIVSTAAAQTLTPVVLELGGKSPVYVDRRCPDLRVTADRIVWGKTANAGQTCVAPDYVLCHEEVLDQFCAEVVKSVRRMYGTEPKKSDMARIVNEAHAQRLVKAIQEVEHESREEVWGHEGRDPNECRIILGGSKDCDVASRFVCPTVVINPGRTTRLMTEEIFGPILPIVPIGSDDDAIEFVRTQQGASTPLAQYVFTTSKSTYEKIYASCPSAMMVRNDVVVQFASSYLPIGGLGTSGSGSYHGRHSLETFSHSRPTVYKPASRAFEYGGVRYAPYGTWRGRLLLVLGGLPGIPVLNSGFWLVVLAVSMVLGLVPAAEPLRVALRGWIADGLDCASLLVRR